MKRTLLMMVCLLVVASITLDTHYAQAQSSTKTITAWGRVNIYAGMMKLPVGTPPNAVLKLESTKRTVKYSKTIQTGSNELTNAFRTGEFRFSSVPAEGQPMSFTLCYTPATGTQSCYSTTYKFYRPTVTILCRERAAGYMGDFIVDIATGSITRKDGKAC